MELRDLVFKFMDEFFLQEVHGPFDSSSNCQKERWELCQSCEHFDESEALCRACGCYLPHKIKDPFGDCPLDKWISNSEQWYDEDYEYLKQSIIEKNSELKEYLNGNN